MKLVDPQDPMFRGLPFGSGSLEYKLWEFANEQDVCRTLGPAVRSGSWRIRRVGQALSMQCANNSRWIVGLTIGGQEPAWLGVKRLGRAWGPSLPMSGPR